MSSRIDIGRRQRSNTFKRAIQENGVCEMYSCSNGRSVWIALNKLKWLSSCYDR